MDYCGETQVPTYENDWIIDPFAGTDLPELPPCCRRVNGHDGESNILYYFCVLQKNYPKDSANIQFWASMYKVYPTVANG